MRSAKTALFVLVFLALTVALGAFFMYAFQSAAYEQPLAPNSAYDKNAMQQAFSDTTVAADLATIDGFGSRFIGQPGFTQTADYIRQAYQAAGLDVTELKVKSAAPVTLERRCLGSDGQPLPGVEIYPFMPNQLQPMVTPANGLSGKLLLVTDDVLKAEHTFSDCIALIDAAAPPTNFDINWTRYAQLGFRAVIVAHRAGLASIPWRKAAAQMVSSVPVNFVRLATTKEIFDHIDQEVCLRVRVEFKNIENTTFVGRLKASQPSHEALLFFTSYDACSILPDLAPGAHQALSLATHLNLVKGLAQYRASMKRDAVFVAYGSEMMGQQGLDAVFRAIGPPLANESTHVSLQREQSDNEAQQKCVEQALAAFNGDAGALVDADATERALQKLDRPTSDFITAQFAYVLDQIVFGALETKLTARIALLKNESAETTRAYLETKRVYDQANTLSGYSPAQLLRTRPEFCAHYTLRQRMLERLTELQAFHRERAAYLDASLALNQAFQPYSKIVMIGTSLAPAAGAKAAKSELGFVLSENAYDSIAESEGGVLADVIRQNNKSGDVTLRFEGRNNRAALYSKIADMPCAAQLGNRLGWPAFLFINPDQTAWYDSFATPVRHAAGADAKSVKKSLEVLAGTALSLLHGNGNFKTPETLIRLATYGGTVYAAGVGQSIVPQFPLAQALVGGKGGSGVFEKIGYYKNLCVFTDPYGRYWIPQTTADVCTWYEGGYEPDVAWHGADGVIAYTKDDGALGQSIYSSSHLGWGGDYSKTNMICFRAAPVSVLDLVNPQTLAPYTGVDFISTDGLSSLERIATFKANDAQTTFIEPDQPFYVLLKAGAAGNPLVQTTRAFMLGDAPKTSTQNEIEGAGYLPGDRPLMLDIPSEVSRSMLRVNAKRLALQREHHMADPQVEQFFRSSEEFYKDSQSPTAEKANSIRDARDSATYSTLIYPEIRDNIYEAVMGIVWYLGLLVLFVFFFEKLAFGFTDIRKQLVTQAFIFLSIFMLLKLLHPAFAMIRSSLMILLGFVIILTSGGITIIFSGKVEENLETLRKNRGQVKAAEVNTLGVIGTAFMLGLNNMHRRIVRTGLTCATLVLITFAIICFTSVQSSVVDRSIAIGKAPYQGLLIKREDLDSISAPELFALQTKYGQKYQVCARETYVGKYDINTKERHTPIINLVYDKAGENSKAYSFSSVLLFTPNEPLQHTLTVLTKSGWFPKEQKPGAPIPIMIPDTVAVDMGVTPQQVDAGGVTVTVNGKRFTVYGIFESAKLQDLQDLDGRSVLPFDLAPMQNPRLSSDARNQVLASDDDPKVSAEKVLLAPVGDLGIIVEGSGNAAGPGKMTLSVAVGMPDLNYKGAKGEIDKYLEQSGQKTYYGLDGTSFVGRRGREQSLSGFLEILIPLILASLTVLNTMKGSVYERRDEIFVYNAVGIAPRFIFFIFFAEAFVYAVVGSELGYILSQGVGRVLTEFNLTGGLNMTFTSRTTIYASMAIMVVTMISSYFPARSAMQIARPTDDASWKLPEPDGDAMRFTLPFTFGLRDRIAVLAFFQRYFSDHGEGSSGLFFAGVPQLGVASGDCGAGVPPATGDAAHPLIPNLASRIWLKPFDLGVSQDLLISLPHDPETKEFIATIELRRVSGTREAWIRLNQNFVMLLRKHFLHWRAVDADERAEMFNEAREILARTATPALAKPAQPQAAPALTQQA